MTLTVERRRDRFHEQLEYLVEDLVILRDALRDGLSRDAIVHEFARVIRDLGGPEA